MKKSGEVAATPRDLRKRREILTILPKSWEATTCITDSERHDINGKIKMSNPHKQRFCEQTKCLFILLVAVIAAIVLVCVLTFTDKSFRAKVKPPKELEWWKTSIIYQVYPRSFQDSNGDGTGDLKGVTSRLDYLKDLGVGAIWLSPFYKSPMRDFGYDVENYTQVDPLFGTMDDFDELMREAKKRNLRVLVDFVPNHTSNESVWFNNSRHSVGKYRDYYVWDDGINCSTCSETNFKKPPNDWTSAFRGSAWTYDKNRKQFYYHAYLDAQPDLNVRNPKVIEELSNVLRFWLHKGVDGFRGDAIRKLFEFQDLHENENGIKNLTRNLREIYPVMKTWKDVLNKHGRRNGQEKILIAESYGITNEMRDSYYEVDTIPFNFAFVQKLNRSCEARCIHEIIHSSLMDLKEDWWPNFVLGSHDVSRIADRMGPELVDVFNMLLLTLPGTPTTYYGEELGMRNAFYTLNESQDPAGLNYKGDYLKHTRDPERSPMQWNSSTNAGFSNGTPWLHVNPNYPVLNVEEQISVDTSSLNTYKRLAKLRQHPSFTNKKIIFSTVNDNIISYIRTDAEKPKYLVVMNFGSRDSTVDCSGPPLVASEGKVVFSIGNSLTETSTDKTGNIINLKTISLKRGQGIIVKI
ncbi:maltase A3-like [Saccostrea echinata]|uniref:maltase A3-like n=1 Tax=Saccostrea echinata TaxID=191078 RepID=UPI002A82EBEF|nr:maltase A3-like [Saccostrea echinata]